MKPYDDIPESDEKSGLVCPQCGKDFVQRAQREGAIERLLSAGYIYPFRCQLCTHRFRALQWGVRYERRWVNKREYHRVATNIPASFSNDRTNGVGVVMNLSMGGCGLETDTPLTAGMLLQLQLTIAADGASVTIEAVAVQNVRTKSVGVQFLRIKPEEKDRLSRYMYELLATAPIPGR